MRKEMNMFNFCWEEVVGDKLGHAINLFFGVLFFHVGYSLLRYSNELFEFGGGVLMAILCGLVAFEVCFNHLFKGLEWYLDYILGGWVKIKEKNTMN